ncbi:MAG: hydrogenase maturation protease [Bacteroidota bacterium]|nr:hydrogenase maturation protease [Bacteroidota bacterium]
MAKKKEHKIGVVGIGNTLRGDDGIGAYICLQIDGWNMEGVTTFVTQQLHTGLIDDLLPFDFIILADAAVTGGPVVFYPLKKDESQPVSSSHHINANLLVSLAQRLHGKELPVMICAVKGENFDMGNQLSPSAVTNANRAINIIRYWIESGCH